jgi:hypothetical protein
MHRFHLLAMLLVALAALPAAAAAAQGTTAIDLGGAAFKSLSAQGGKIAAKRPARVVRGALRLPVRQGVVGSVALLNHSGSVRIRKRNRAVRLTRLQVRLGSSSRVSATVGGRRLVVFSITPVQDVSLNAAAGSASLRDARLRLTAPAAKTIKRALELQRRPAGRFGTITVDALVNGTGSAPGGDGGGGPGGGDPSAPPASPPITDEPPLLPRPATAVDVTGATVTWHVRDSWIRYVSTERDVAPLGGAIPGPAIPQDQHACPDNPASAAPPPLVYSYRVPFAGGWHDAASGQTALYTTGGVRFAFPSHGIDLDAKDLELEINGAASRLIARFDGRGATNPGNKRAVLARLALSTPPAPGAPAATLKGAIPSGGSESVFAGFYRPGDGFGCVTVSYTL